MSRFAFITVTLSLLAIAGTAHADEDARKRAQDAYDRGADAHKHGEMARAAEEFARADAYEPSAVALQAALDAAIDADDVALGAELLERAKREPAPPGLAGSITAAHIKFNARAGRIRIACPKNATCNAKIDDAPAPVDRVVWTGIGQRNVSIQVDSAAPQAKSVDVGTDQIVLVTSAKGGLVARPMDAASADDVGAKTAPKESRGVSPVVVYASGGVTIALAALTTFFMVKTSGKHGDFEDKNCSRLMTAECNDLSDAGRSSQSAANVALVFTALAALTTGVIAVGFTNWGGKPRSSAFRQNGAFSLSF